MNQDQESKMIDLLKENSRITLTELSRKLRVPISDIFHEITKLKDRYKFTIVEKSIKANFIGNTNVAGREKHRWECPVCRGNKEPECRFSLSTSKVNKIHKCRFCGTELLLKK